jgi:hypothetical protein
MAVGRGSVRSSILMGDEGRVRRLGRRGPVASARERVVVHARPLARRLRVATGTMSELDTQPTLNTPSVLGTDRTPSPQWWADKHTSAWERAKDALRRDWEQTKADFGSKDAHDLNQNVADTAKQIAGSAPVLPLTTKTRPDEPKDVAKHLEKGLRASDKAQGKMATARTDIAIEKVKADAKFAQQLHDGNEKVAHEQVKLGEIAADNRETIAKGAMKADERLAKQELKIADARAETHEKLADVGARADAKIAKQQDKLIDAKRDLQNIEPAIRFGHGARLEYGDRQWDDAIERRLGSEWSEFNSVSAWEDAVPHVRYGWNSVDRA